MRPPTWAYCLTTVPQRRKDVFPRTLASLQTAGFPSPRLFVDGITNADAASWEREFGLEVVVRNPLIRAYGNWILALWEMWIRNPTASLFAVFQDDFVTCRNLRAYLERRPMPPQAYLNLYTFRQNEDVIAGKPPGWCEGHELVTSGSLTFHGKPQQKGLGAVALVFPRDAVQALLSHPHMVQKAASAGDRGWMFIDGGVVEAMNRSGWREFVHSPSLVQHTGTVRVIGRGGTHPLALTFPGESFDALTLLPATMKAEKGPVKEMTP